MSKQLILMTFLSALALAAAASETQESFDTAYQAAEEARRQAADVGYEWRDTEEMLEDAKGAAANSDFDTAVKLANEAKTQGELGVQQAAREAEAWKSRVLK